MKKTGHIENNRLRIVLSPSTLEDLGYKGVPLELIKKWIEIGRGYEPLVVDLKSQIESFISVSLLVYELVTVAAAPNQLIIDKSIQRPGNPQILDEDREELLQSARAKLAVLRQMTSKAFPDFPRNALLEPEKD